MIKKIFITFLLIFSFFWLTLNSFAADPGIPTVNCIGLPWCKDSNIAKPAAASYDNMVDWGWVVYSVTSELITMLIKYTAVIAVISVMISWFMYMLSFWDEEKTKKAKSWIIWSLAWVAISISAWWIINIINNIAIT